MGRRYRLKAKPGAYVERDKEGKFKDWSNIGRSIRVDAGKLAKNVPSKSGYGHQGDYQYHGIPLVKVEKIKEDETQMPEIDEKGRKGHDRFEIAPAQEEKSGSKSEVSKEAKQTSNEGTKKEITENKQAEHEHPPHVERVTVRYGDRAKPPAKPESFKIVKTRTGAYQIVYLDKFGNVKRTSGPMDLQKARASASKMSGADRGSKIRPHKKSLTSRLLKGY